MSKVKNSKKKWVLTGNVIQDDSQQSTPSKSTASRKRSRNEDHSHPSKKKCEPEIQHTGTGFTINQEDFMALIMSWLKDPSITYKPH